MRMWFVQLLFPVDFHCVFISFRFVFIVSGVEWRRWRRTCCSTTATVAFLQIYWKRRRRLVSMGFWLFHSIHWSLNNLKKQKQKNKPKTADEKRNSTTKMALETCWNEDTESIHRSLMGRFSLISSETKDGAATTIATRFVAVLSASNRTDWKQQKGGGISWLLQLRFINYFFFFNTRWKPNCESEIGTLSKPGTTTFPLLV